MKFVAYDPSTGEIKVWGDGDDPSNLAGHGTVIEDAEGSPFTHHVVDGALVAYTPDQTAAKAAMPPYAAIWSNSSMTWEDPRAIDQAKVDQWELVKAARDETMGAGFVWGGSEFDSDDLSQQRIQGAVQLAVLAAQAGQPFSIEWTLFDNSTRTLSSDDMIAVGLALGAFVQTAFSTGVALRERINAATSVDAVKEVVWTPA